MDTAVDRPRSVLYEHPSGAKAFIGFIWGFNFDPVPKGLRIQIQSAQGEIQILHEKAIYTSFDQAVQQGTKIANAVIDLYPAAPID